MQGQVLPMLFRLQNSFLQYPSRRLINIHLLACQVKILTRTNAGSPSHRRRQLSSISYQICCVVRVYSFTQAVNNMPQCILARLLLDLNTGPSKVNLYSPLIISSLYYYQA